MIIGLNSNRTGSTACHRTCGCRLHAGAPGNTSWSNPYMQGLWNKRKKNITYESLFLFSWYFKITLFYKKHSFSLYTSIKVVLHYVRASVPFFSGCGQKLVLQAWDIEGLRWRAQPEEGFPWTRHWTVLACTPPPHVTVHCRVQRNKTLMMDTMNVMKHALHIHCPLSRQSTSVDEVTK